MSVGPLSGKEGEKSRPLDHIRQIHPNRYVCIIYLHQYLSKCKRFPIISSMWYLHRALKHALQGLEPCKGHVVFHLVRASVHWYDIKTIGLMFLGINKLWARLRLKPLGDSWNELWAGAQNILMSKNINCITIIISLEVSHKIKLEKFYNKTVWKIFLLTTLWSERQQTL